VERGDFPDHTITDTAMLGGSGAYQGLTAHLVFDWGTWPGQVMAAIIPGDLAPQIEEFPEQ
jgi:hypothetical protein